MALSITPEELAACRQPAPATTVDEPQPSPAATPPAPVLTAQPLFVGREDLLGRIDAACAHSEGAVIQSIQGMGGVGKTALARQAAKRFAEKGLTPDGQVFVNLRGWNSGQRMSTADALRSLCTQLDRNIDQTYSEEQLAAHWRGLTRGKRLVVILDNAADAAQVEALRPTDGITLITTRRLGLIRGIGTVDVDVMREGDAAELAQRLCPGLDEERARRLSKAVGYLPLAIEIAAGRLADGVEALEALEAKLIDSVKALDLLEELREVLSFSLAGLTDEQVARWEALSLPPGDFGEWAVQALWQTDDWANDMLALRRRHLLSPFGEGRWRLHDLLRAAAAERLTEDLEREQQLWRRLGPAAVVRLEEINKCFISGDGAMVLALATMDQELPLLRGVQSWAAGKMERDRVAAEVASRLPNYVITTLRLGRDELTWREAALCAAEHRREKAEIARAAGTLGLVYRHRGDYSRAEAMHLRSLAIAEALGDSVEQAKQRGNLGLVYDQCGRLDEAEEMLEASIAIFEELGDRAGAARNLGNLGLVYQHRGNSTRLRRCTKGAFSSQKNSETWQSKRMILTNSVLCIGIKANWNRLRLCT